MCKNITHGHYYQWIDVDSATHVKCSFESSASQMFFFATQHFEFVSWGQITSRFCCKYSSTVLYFIDYCFALTGTKKTELFFIDSRNANHRKIVATHGLATPVLARLEV